MFYSLRQTFRSGVMSKAVKSKILKTMLKPTAVWQYNNGCG
jgi:hypothetical protein